MELDLDICRVRPWRASDLRSLVRHADNRLIWINLRDRFPYPYTEQAGRHWLASANSSGHANELCDRSGWRGGRRDRLHSRNRRRTYLGGGGLLAGSGLLGTRHRDGRARRPFRTSRSPRSTSTGSSRCPSRRIAPRAACSRRQGTSSRRSFARARSKTAGYSIRRCMGRRDRSRYLRYRMIRSHSLASDRATTATTGSVSLRLKTSCGTPGSM